MQSRSQYLNPYIRHPEPKYVVSIHLQAIEHIICKREHEADGCEGPRTREGAVEASGFTGTMY